MISTDTVTMSARSLFCTVFDSNRLLVSLFHRASFGVRLRCFPFTAAQLIS